MAGTAAPEYRFSLNPKAVQFAPSVLGATIPDLNSSEDLDDKAIQGRALLLNAVAKPLVPLARQNTFYTHFTTYLNPEANVFVPVHVTSLEKSIQELSLQHVHSCLLNAFTLNDCNYRQY